MFVELGAAAVVVAIRLFGPGTEMDHAVASSFRLLRFLRTLSLTPSFAPTLLVAPPAFPDFPR